MIRHALFVFFQTDGKNKHFLNTGNILKTFFVFPFKIKPSLTSGVANEHFYANCFLVTV